MTDLFLLSAADAPNRGYFPLSHGIARGDNRRVVRAIVFVIQNGLHWRGAHKTIYDWFVRWSRQGVFSKTFAHLARKGGKADRITTDAPHLPQSQHPPRKALDRETGMNVCVSELRVQGSNEMISGRRSGRRKTPVGRYATTQYTEASQRLSNRHICQSRISESKGAFQFRLD